MDSMPLDELKLVILNLLEMSTTEDLLTALADGIEKREMYCRTNWPEKPETYEFLTDHLVTVRNCLSEVSAQGKQRAEDAEIRRKILLEETQAERARQDEYWKKIDDEAVEPILAAFVAKTTGHQLKIEKPTSPDEGMKILVDGVELVGQDETEMSELLNKLTPYVGRDDVFEALVACGLKQPKPVPMAPPPPLADSASLMLEAIRDLTSLGATQEEVDKLIEVYTIKGFEGQEDKENAHFKLIASEKLNWLRSERMMGRLQ